MGFAKEAIASLNKNNRISRFFASNLGGSYARWAAVGAGLGAIRGMADNIVGEDKVSVLGGAIQGAMLGAGARGIGQLWGAGRGKGSGSVQRSRALSTYVSSGGRASGGIGASGFTFRNSPGTSGVARGRIASMGRDITPYAEWRQTFPRAKYRGNRGGMGFPFFR